LIGRCIFTLKGTLSLLYLKVAVVQRSRAGMMSRSKTWSSVSVEAMKRLLFSKKSGSILLRHVRPKKRFYNYQGKEIPDLTVEKSVKQGFVSDIIYESKELYFILLKKICQQSKERNYA
jgi:hypothetical protein